MAKDLPHSSIKMSVLQNDRTSAKIRKRPTLVANTQKMLSSRYNPQGGIITDASDDDRRRGLLVVKKHTSYARFALRNLMVYHRAPPRVDVDECVRGGGVKHVNAQPILHHVPDAAHERALTADWPPALGEAVCRPNSILVMSHAKILHF